MTSGGFTGFPVSAAKRTPEGGSTLGMGQESVKQKTRSPRKARASWVSNTWKRQSCTKAAPLLMLSNTLWAKAAACFSPEAKSDGLFTDTISL